MSALENLTDKFKHFGPTTWSIKNKTAIYLLMLIVSGWGVYKFITLPKEQFPDIVIPTIYVSTIYTGNSPKDMENLVTRPIENFSGYFCPSSVGSSSPPMATMVTPEPPVRVVKNALATKHTTARPPGIQPKNARAAPTMRSGAFDSASR